MRTIRSRRAVSPVIATVILVAVTITVAVAVAYWMGGIAGQYTKFEKIEIQSSVCSWEPTVGSEHWIITMKLKNSGTATATLIGVFINDIEVDDYSAVDPALTQASTDMTTKKTVKSGDTVTIGVYIDDAWESVTSGTTVNIKIHSAGGMDYIRLVELV